MKRTFKEALKDVLIRKGIIDMQNLVDIIDKWPSTIIGETIIYVDYDLPEEEDEYGPEPQDIENWGITEIEDDHMIMCCGGDWQTPMVIRIELVNNLLTVTEAEAGLFEYGFEDEEILEKLN